MPKQYRVSTIAMQSEKEPWITVERFAYTGEIRTRVYHVKRQRWDSVGELCQLKSGGSIPIAYGWQFWFTYHLWDEWRKEHGL